MSATATMELSAYIEAVRACLDAVPPEERGDLLEDLEQHLTEVAAESDEPLEQRLGSPAAYAAELLASAGYATRAVPGGPSVVARLRARSAQVRTGMPELVPGWWVARGLAAAGGFGLIVGNHRLVGGDFAVILVAACLAVPASVWLGRQTAAGRLRGLSAIASAGVLLVAFVTLNDVRHDVRPVYDQEPYEPQQLQSGLYGTNGRPILNIYPFASDGTPLEGVLLYDQDGVPLDNLSDATLDGRPIERQTPVRNSYPQPVLIPDERTGQLRPDRRPTVVIPKVIETTTTTAAAPAPPP